ncbi:hypothetical protein BKA67DRAFT_547388 [Truncatella angustata]|uniref:Gpi-anchored protein n=1 Tax=Truncatella angustata TaxID=152316 RepID=A0A9P9A398_9PEZI|nr:uncharacterized protein BKA67DRAFT_547388 [Truncatella angustata]KAH6660242.1 hypothetical protein BKA67DRAFT_547388 [Truncatella angustata]
MRIPRSIGSSSAVLTFLVSLTAANNIPPLGYSPFATMEKRDACPANYVSCDSLGSAFSGICCAGGQYCALDTSNQPACCPSGAVCTGTAASTATGTVTSVSYVTNSYFAFPAIATSFSNAGACSAAVSACSSNYALCTSDLASGTGGYAVTISVPGGGGVTQQPTHTQLAVSQATSICAGLSSAACHGLSASRCATVGTTGGFVVGTANAAMPRITAAPCIVGMVAGVGLGVLGGAF